MSWQGKYQRPSSLYPKKWNAMRWIIFKQYNFCCQICGRYAKGNLVLHHIVPIKISHDNRPQNLMVVCKQCHEMIHKDYIEKKRRFNDF